MSSGYFFVWCNGPSWFLHHVCFAILFEHHETQSIQRSKGAVEMKGRIADGTTLELDIITNIMVRRATFPKDHYPSLSNQPFFVLFLAEGR